MVETNKSQWKIFVHETGSLRNNESVSGGEHSFYVEMPSRFWFALVSTGRKEKGDQTHQTQYAASASPVSQYRVSE